MLYRAPGCALEKRRITPLVIEQRGEHTYIIAYYHASQPQRAVYVPSGSDGSAGGVVMQ